MTLTALSQACTEDNETRRNHRGVAIADGLEGVDDKGLILFSLILFLPNKGMELVSGIIIGVERAQL
jgi:hypothetical protein